MNPWTGGLGWTVLADATANVTGTCTGVGTTVTATSAVFTAGMVGHSIAITDEGTFTIASFTSTTIVEVDDDATCVSKAFTVSMDDSGALTASGSNYIRDATTNPGGAAADILITPVTTDVWDVRVTAKVALSSVWIPWQGTAYSTTGGAFFVTRRQGLRVDMTVAKELLATGTCSASGTNLTATTAVFTAAMVGASITIATIGTFTISTFVNSTQVTVSGVATCTSKAFSVGLTFAHSAFNWQGDEASTYQYPGDFAIPGIGYDDGTTGTWVGLCDDDTTVETLFSLGRQSLKYGSMAVAEIITFRVYIGQTTTGNERARIASLVAEYGENTLRPAGRVGEDWWSIPGFLDVQTQDHADPKTTCYDLWDEWGELLPAMICWGQMSDEGETCCGYSNKLHARNKWMRDFSIKVQNDGGLFGIYTRPADTGNDPDKAIEGLRCASLWCNAAYCDVIGAGITTATLPIRNLLVEQASLRYAHASLVSACFAGDSHPDCQSAGDAPAGNDCLTAGSFSASKQAIATGGGVYTTTDPGETRPNAESYPYSRWCRTCAWLGKVFNDNTGTFSVRPTKWFVGPENSDANYPNWNLTNSFMMGIGMAVRQSTIDDYEDVIELILDEWDDFGFWNGDYRYLDRIGCTLTTPSSGVDFRRFTNEDGNTILAIDQYALARTSVVITVDGTPETITMGGQRFKLINLDA